MRHRDERGRFRPATDTEKGITPAMRAMFDRINERFRVAVAVEREQARVDVEFHKFYSGDQWPSRG